MKRTGQLTLALVVAAILCLTPAHVPACGPFFERATFTFRTVPENAALAAGELGVIFPTFWRRYLFSAYRHLEGTPFTAEERLAYVGQQPSEPDALKVWAETRRRVPASGEVPRIDRFRQVPGSQWQYFQNCNDGAFLNAAQTLASRIDTFGADHPAVRDWLEAQDSVLSLCGAAGPLPSTASPDLPPAFHQDRAYQIAAAHFYALELHDAEAGFARIAEDRASPWSGVAPYLVARCRIRRATLTPEPGHMDLDLLSRAAEGLRGLMADESRSAWHDNAQRLLDHINAMLNPESRLAEVAAELSRPVGDAAEFEQNLTDFVFLMDRGVGSDPAARETDLVDWVVAFQSGASEAFQHAIERWDQNRQPVWLIAAITKVQGADPHAPELMSAAAELPEASPAWPTATYHRVRLLVEQDRTEEARDVLDHALAAKDRLSGSTENLFRGQRLSLARDIEEFMRFAARKVLRAGMDLSQWTPNRESDPAEMLDGDAVAVLNQGLPLAALVQIAESSVLPEPIRRDVATVAWVRAILLEDWAIARHISPRMPGNAATVSDPFSAAYFLLKNPGLRPYLVSGTSLRRDVMTIDNYRRNWWCAFQEVVQLDGIGFYQHQQLQWGQERPSGALPEPAGFLEQNQKDEFLREWGKLSALDTAPNWLAQTVIEHVRAHPDDPRAPEALHLAVRATRYGCSNGQTGRSSQAAFRLLHSRYPDSEWAKKTPYWFE